MDDEVRRALEREVLAGGSAEREALTRAALASGRGRVLAWVPDDPARLPPGVGEVRARVEIGGSRAPAPGTGVVFAVAVIDLDDMTRVASRIARWLMLVVLEDSCGYVGFGGPPWKVRLDPYEGDDPPGVVGALPQELIASLGGGRRFVDLIVPPGMGDFLPQGERPARDFPDFAAPDPGAMVVGGPSSGLVVTGGVTDQGYAQIMWDPDAAWLGDPPAEAR